MNEQSHAEMQKFHYQALSNPIYRMEGQLDVLREEMMLSIPPMELTQAVQESTQNETEEIKSQLIYLEGKLQELTKKDTINKYTINK